MTKLTIGAPSDPLRIEATGDTQFLGLLFSSNSKSMRYWAKLVISLGPNANWNLANGTWGTTSFSNAAYGKTFPTYPWVLGTWDSGGGGQFATRFSYPIGAGQVGWFLHAYNSYVTAANTSGFSDTARILVFDLNATG